MKLVNVFDIVACSVAMVFIIAGLYMLWQLELVNIFDIAMCCVAIGFILFAVFLTRWD